MRAVNCRSNHVHAVVSADDRELDTPRIQFKSWTTRRLKERQAKLFPGQVIRLNWWTERGWDEYIDNELELANVIEYVLEGQKFG